MFYSIIGAVSGFLLGGLLALFFVSWRIKRGIQKGKPPFGITVVDSNQLDDDEEKPRH